MEETDWQAPREVGASHGGDKGLQIDKAPPTRGPQYNVQRGSQHSRPGFSSHTYQIGLDTQAHKDAEIQEPSS